MNDRSHRFHPHRKDTYLIGVLCCWSVVVALAFCCSRVSQAQGMGSPALRTDRIDLPTPINQPPDLNAQIRSRHMPANRQNMDAANALRQKQISDEALKVLILARDFRAKVARLGSDPMPAALIREAEIIENFAHDVQQKMVLAPGPE